MASEKKRAEQDRTEGNQRGNDGKQGRNTKRSSGARRETKETVRSTAAVSCASDVSRKSCVGTASSGRGVFVLCDDRVCCLSAAAVDCYALQRAGRVGVSAQISVSMARFVAHVLRAGDPAEPW